MLYTAATYRQYRTRFELSPPTRPCSTLDSRPLTSLQDTRCSEFRSRTSRPTSSTLFSRTWWHPDVLARVFRSRRPTAPSFASFDAWWGGSTNSSTWFRRRRCASVRPALLAASDVKEQIRGRPSSGASRATHSSTMWPEQPMSTRRIRPLAVEDPDFLAAADGFGEDDVESLRCLLFVRPSGLMGGLPRLFFPDAAKRSCLPRLVLAVLRFFGGEVVRLHTLGGKRQTLPRVQEGAGRAACIACVEGRRRLTPVAS